MRVVAAAFVIAALAAASDDSDKTYSRSDVERAFSSQGLELIAADFPEATLLAPKTGEEFDVVYLSEREGRGQRAPDAKDLV